MDPVLPLPVIVKPLQLNDQDFGQSADAQSLHSVHLKNGKLELGLRKGSVAHFLVTLLTVVGIGSLKKVSLNKGIQTLKQVLLVAYINVESCERLLSGVPAPADRSSKYTTH